MAAASAAATARSSRLPQVVLLLALAVAAMVSIALRLDLSPQAEITRFRDDAYYFFTWARSLATGGGPCVTPGVPTSGVQLLWGLLLVPVAMVGGAAALPPAAQILGLALHVATALLLGWLLHRRGVGPRLVAPAVALVYLGNPFLLTEAQNGQETALACLSALLLLAATPRRAGSGSGSGDLAFVAAALLATLARTDLLLLVPFLALARHGLRPRAAVAPTVAFTGLVAVDLLLAGHLLPDSALPIPWLFEQHFLAGDPSPHARLMRLWWWLRPCLLGGPWQKVSLPLAAALVAVVARVLMGPWLTGWRRLAPLLLTALAGLCGAADLEVPLGAGVILAWWPAGRRGAPAFPWVALLCGWFAVLFVHHVLRHYPRDYYYAPLGVAGAAAAAQLCSWSPRLGLGLLCAAAGSQVWQSRAPTPPRGWQEEMRMAALALPAVLDEAAPVGSFNCGLLSFLRQGPVVNLDGVVNSAAFAALRADALDRYLDAQGVCVLVDMPVQFARDDPWPHASGRHFGPTFEPGRALRELIRCDVPEVDQRGVAGTDAVRLYWRVGSGAPPAIPPGARLLGAIPGGGGRYVLWRGSRGAELSCTGPDGATRPLGRGLGDIGLVVSVPTPAPGRYILHLGSPADPLLVLDSSP